MDIYGILLFVGIGISIGMGIGSVRAHRRAMHDEEVLAMIDRALVDSDEFPEAVLEATADRWMDAMVATTEGETP